MRGLPKWTRLNNLRWLAYFAWIYRLVKRLMCRIAQFQREPVVAFACARKQASASLHKLDIIVPLTASGIFMLAEVQPIKSDGVALRVKVKLHSKLSATVEQQKILIIRYPLCKSIRKQWLHHLKCILETTAAVDAFAAALARWASTMFEWCRKS